MARKRIITPEKKELIRNLISEYNITSAKGFANSRAFTFAFRAGRGKNHRNCVKVRQYGSKS